MPFFPSPARDRSTGRWPTRSLLDNALAVAAVALLLVGLSGEVRGALAGLMVEVEGTWTIVPMH
ncbi:hypothetical protein GBZ48_31740 [Azospirillum melinis]|uniref:Uncharacterized protein n=1 Tax=Azospirillum melinis TaxID=328839 RepID=A0ABX2KPS8_9PROT|nr:hypothetical protein [Azospirillum melinis]MBP2305179.1 hypothetical protein [Azospirillum melinis]NUB03788.1 hypothetical protein [Azospirillum melinis]